MRIEIPQTYGYDQDPFSAVEAISEAQRIAHSPMFFHAACLLRDKGILQALDDAGSTGINFTTLQAQLPLSDYALSLLLDNGLSMRILQYQDGFYQLGKVGYFLLHDEMTRVNMDFSRDICYAGMAHLEEAINTGKPAGLAQLIDAESIYPVLSQLPAKAQASWFAYDHFYSDSAFRDCLPLIFKHRPAHIYDIGGNTGKWARTCVAYDPDVQITILDLPQQTKTALEHSKDHPGAERIHVHPLNVLESNEFPAQADIWWMSQFLDCFSETQIIDILRKVHAAAKPEARLCILELLWNRQKYEAAALSLNAASLYFTAIANGTSRFYSAETFYKCLHAAGFEVESQIDHIGYGHSLLICRKQIN